MTITITGLNTPLDPEMAKGLYGGIVRGIKHRITEASSHFLSDFYEREKPQLEMMRVLSHFLGWEADVVSGDFRAFMAMLADRAPL